MRRYAAILALLGTQFAAPVAAEPIAGQFKTYGACASAYYQLLNKEWKADGKSARLMDFDPSHWCVWTGEVYVLLPMAAD